MAHDATARAQRAGVAAVVAASALLVLTLSGSTWAAPACVLDVDDDGDAAVVDPAGHELCQWPKGTTNIHGTLTFRAGTAVEFVGAVSVRAQAIVVESGATLRGEGETLRKFNLVALNPRNGDIRSEGTIDVEARDGLNILAKRSIDLAGVTNIKTSAVMVIRASQGDVSIDPPAVAPDTFTLFARDRINIDALGGNVDIARAHIGAFRIIVRTRAFLSTVGPKELRLRDGALVTTDPAKTGLTFSSHILLDATDRIVITGDVTVAAGTNLTLRTLRKDDDVCISNDVTLEVHGGRGQIFLQGVHGTVFDDGTTTFRAFIVGGGIVPGTCDGGATTTSTTVPPPRPTTIPTTTSTTTTTHRGTTTTAPSGGLTPAEWQFYVRIARTDGSETNVAVPKRSTDAPIGASIRTDDLAAFPIDSQVTGTEIGALGDDTLARLTDAAQTYIAGHPTDYPGFARIVTLLWAKRVASAAVPTTTITTTTTTRRTTTTAPSGDLTPAQWEFYVRIARTDGSETNVNVPKRSTDAPVGASIRTDDLAAFPIDSQVTGTEIGALGDDTLARLTSAAQTYIAGHPTDYPGFARIVALLWAKRTP